MLIRTAFSVLAICLSLCLPVLAQDIDYSLLKGPQGSSSVQSIPGTESGTMLGAASLTTSAGASGAQRRETGRTGAGAWQDFTPDRITQMPGKTFTTGRGSKSAGDFNGANLPRTQTTQYGIAPGLTASVQSLPPTRLSSFVADSGMNESIYGDEGTEGPPPIDGFQYGNTINSGISNSGLSTGHASELPSSWL